MKKTLVKVWILLFIFIIVPIHHTVAWDTTQPWTTQADGCNAVTGNINTELDYVYVGIGSTVPQSILNLYPSASSSFLEDWKTNLTGMTVNEFKSFIELNAYSTGTLAGNSFGKQQY